MRYSRQNKIIEIINNNEVDTQEKLAALLRESGFEVTQATISRDIKELQLVKELGSNGKYHYVVSGKSKSSDRELRLRKIFRESVTSYNVAQNIIVIKTLPGLASAACSTLDSMHIESLAGTLAGDDTAFLAMKDNKAAEGFCHEIEEMF